MRIFWCKFLCKSSLVRCPCEFRPRRLAQDVRLIFSEGLVYWRAVFLFELCPCRVAGVKDIQHFEIENGELRAGQGIGRFLSAWQVWHFLRSATTLAGGGQNERCFWSFCSFHVEYLVNLGRVLTGSKVAFCCRRL